MVDTIGNEKPVNFYNSKTVSKFLLNILLIYLDKVKINLVACNSIFLSCSFIVLWEGH